jgi:Tfp pilus assembly protein PilF
LIIPAAIVACIIFYIIINFRKKVTYYGRIIWIELFLYWILVIILFIILIGIPGYLNPRLNPYDRPLPWVMALLSILFLIYYVIIEVALLRLSRRISSLSFLRLIFFRRFTIIGDSVIRLEKGWRANAVKFIDVLVGVWLVQSLSRILWHIAGPGSFDEFNYSEIIRLPNNTSTGYIFNNFNINNSSKLAAISFSGDNFALDLISSISSLLWNNWMEIVAIWFLLEVISVTLSSSKKVVIVDGSEDSATSAKKDSEKKGEAKETATAPTRLSELLAVKLARINNNYRALDEKRPIQSACGVGEPIDAAIKTEHLDDISLGSSNIGLGPLSIPTRSISALISHILRGPKIVVSLHCRKDEEIQDNKSRWFLTASMTGKAKTYSWLVDSADSIEEDFRGKERTVDDMVMEMAHRISSSLREEKTSQSINWKAMWKYNEGIRAYRDCLNTTRQHKFYLSKAEKNFLDAIEEQNTFSQAYYNLGVVYAELNQLSAAEACFQKAIDADPQLWEAYYALGIAVFRLGKETEQQYRLLGMSMDAEDLKAAKKRIKENYSKAIRLCQRVEEIRHSQDGMILDINYNIRAKVQNLKGNALARQGCMNCPANRIDMPCGKGSGKDNYADLKAARDSLEEAVYSSWRGLIKESVLNETAEDESKIVSECTQDLADIYLKMINCNKDNADSLISKARSLLLQAILINNARSMLQQAIYVYPNDINLYLLLGKVSEYQKKGGRKFAEMIYYQALRIKPESPRLKAHYLASDEKEKNNGEIKGAKVWLDECERSGCMDNDIYEETFYFLAKAIEEDCDTNKYAFLRDLCKKEKLESNLGKILGKGEGAASILQRKKCVCSCEEDATVCTTLLRLARDWGEENIDCQCLLTALRDLEGKFPEKALRKDLKNIIYSYIKIDGKNLNLQSWTELGQVDRERNLLKLVDDLFHLGLIYFEMGRIKAEAKLDKADEREFSGIWQKIHNDKEKYLDQAKDCFLVLLKILEYGIDNELASKDDSKEIQPGLKIRSSGKCRMNYEDDLFSIYYKIKSAHYLIESGKILLELGRVKRLLEPMDSEGSVSWNDLLKDRERLIDFVKRQFCINWIKDKELNIDIKENAIIVRNENNLISLKLRDNTLAVEIDDFGAKELRVENENGDKIIHTGTSSCYECFICSMQAFQKAKRILKQTDPEEIGRKKIRLQLAKTYQACGKLHIALKEAQKARIENPLDYEVLTVLGDIFCELKEFKFGLTELENAISCKADDPALLLNVGRAHFWAGKDCRKKNGEDRTRILKKAKEYLEEALEIEDRSRVRQRGEIRYWIGKTLLEMARYDEAMPHFRILSQPPLRSPLTRTYLGYAYVRSNTHEEGERELSNLIKSYPKPLNGIVYGWRFNDQVDANEILAWAHIYLAYSYALRDANLYESWKIASKSQKFIRNMKEKGDHKHSTRDDAADNLPNAHLSLEDYTQSVPEPRKEWLDSLQEYSCIKCNGDYYKHYESPLFSLQSDAICIEFDPWEGPRKRRVKANLAKCSGLICHKMGHHSPAIKFLEASVSLYPDAEAYLILARAWQGRLNQSEPSESEKALVDRKILDLCQQVEKLDVKQKYAQDLQDFKARYVNGQSGQPVGEDTAKDKSSK